MLYSIVQFVFTFGLHLVGGVTLVLAVLSLLKVKDVESPAMKRQAFFTAAVFLVPGLVVFADGPVSMICLIGIIVLIIKAIALKGTDSVPTVNAAHNAQVAPVIATPQPSPVASPTPATSTVYQSAPIPDDDYFEGQMTEEELRAMMGEAGRDSREPKFYAADFQGEPALGIESADSVSFNAR